MLHLPDNMVSFGAIPNFMAESPEMFLKFTVKKAGKRAQKRKDGTTFEQQSARRLFNIMLTDDLYKAMNEEPCGPEKNDNTDWLNSDTPVSSNVNPSEIEDDEDSDDDSIEEAVEKESIFESVANGIKYPFHPDQLGTRRTTVSLYCRVEHNIRCYEITTSNQPAIIPCCKIWG